MTEYLSELNAAKAALGETPWHYVGDENAEHGGLYWRADSVADDYVNAVEITPCSDAGGPDNKFDIAIGSIYMPPDKLESALSATGTDPANATLLDKVLAYHAYSGIERDSMSESGVLQIGPDEGDETDFARGWNPDPDERLPEGTDLRRYVEENYLD